MEEGRPPSYLSRSCSINPETNVDVFAACAYRGVEPKIRGDGEVVCEKCSSLA